MFGPTFYTERLDMSPVADKGGIFEATFPGNGTVVSRADAVHGAMVALSFLSETMDIQESEIFILCRVALRRDPCIGEYAAVIEALRPFGIYVPDTFGKARAREEFTALYPEFTERFPNLF